MADRPGLRLKTARLSQTRGSDGEAWSQDNFLDAIAAEGWRPAYKNYLDTERGLVTPKPETWKRYVKFWKTRKIDLDALELPEPESIPAPEPLDVLSALGVLARAWATEQQAQAARFRAVEERAEVAERSILEMSNRLAAVEAAMSPARSVPRATTGSGR